MLPLRFVAATGLVLAFSGCAFDSGGLQTGSNSNGTLESSGSEGGEGPSTTAPTSTTAGTSVTTTTTDPTNTSTTATTEDTSSTSPTTTMQPTDTTAEESTTGDPTTTGPMSTESSTSEAESSSDSGVEVPPYGECDGDEDCGGGVCIGLYTNFELNHHVCYPLPSCMMHDECPAPDGGDAMAICTMAGCTLDCGGGLSCPAGMTCAYTDEGNRRCGWPD